MKKRKGGKLFDLHHFPPKVKWEDVYLLKRLSIAHRFLAETKGLVNVLPNQHILINTLFLQESKLSSEIENIVTTHDELFKVNARVDQETDLNIKEVKNYAVALMEGYNRIKENGLLTTNTIVAVQSKLENNNEGIRKMKGTVLSNSVTNEVIYSPPQEYEEIIELLHKLEQYINISNDDDPDPLVKMALIHFQFEAIHPFYDANGRTGRILNTLFLVLTGLLDIPVLYLSKFILENKKDYYRLLSAMNYGEGFLEWILFMLTAVEVTAKHSLVLIKDILALHSKLDNEIKAELPKIHSPELLTNLFKNPYTKVDLLMEDTGISRITATKYLDLLSEHRFLEKRKSGRTIYFVNKPLVAKFMAMDNDPIFRQSWLEEQEKMPKHYSL